MLSGVALGAQAHVAKHKHHKHHKHHKSGTGTQSGPSGPSLTVVGFGVNRLFVADGATVSNPADCSTMVGGNGSPYGPPQNIYVVAYVKATNIPESSPTQIAFTFPGGEALDDEEPTLGPAAPFSTTFGTGTLGFGSPPGSQANLFRFNLASTDDPNGPSASDFDGTYTFEASVVANGKTIDEKATADVNC